MNTLLKVVGVTAESKEAVEARVNSLEQLKEKTEAELERFLFGSTVASTKLSSAQLKEDFRRLRTALHSLRKYCDILLQQQVQPLDKLDLHWDSWTNANKHNANSAANSADVPMSPKADTSMTMTAPSYATPPMSMSVASSTSSSVSGNSSCRPSIISNYQQQSQVCLMATSGPAISGRNNRWLFYPAVF